MRRCFSALLAAILLIACSGCGDRDFIRFDDPDSRKYGEPDPGEGGGHDPGGHGVHGGHGERH